MNSFTGKDANAMMEWTGKARELVKSELLELILTLNRYRITNFQSTGVVTY